MHVRRERRFDAAEVLALDRRAEGAATVAVSRNRTGHANIIAHRHLARDDRAPFEVRVPRRGGAVTARVQMEEGTTVRLSRLR
jgi:hypothetical protein